MYTDEIIDKLGKTYVEQNIKERFKFTFEDYLHIMVNIVWNKTPNKGDL